MSIKSQPEDEAQNEEDGDLLDGYENDNGDYGPLSDSLDKHSFSRMSHALGRQMFREGTKPIEFREGMVFKNFREFAWALKDYCIQQSFRGKRIKFERKRILCGCYADKCPFRVYAAINTHTLLKASITILRYLKLG